MSRVRVVMEEFVEGDLDFAELQNQLSEQLSAGATREEALHALKALIRREKLSPAVLAILRRSIDRQFSSDDTDPFPHIRPSEERGAGRSSGNSVDPGTDAALPAMYAEAPAPGEAAAEASDDGAGPELTDTTPEWSLDLSELEIGEPVAEPSVPEAEPEAGIRHRSSQPGTGRQRPRPRPRTYQRSHPSVTPSPRSGTSLAGAMSWRA
jgi:hypothetical protein